MREFKVPSREEVSESNQAIFDNLNQKLGFVPNLYAYYAKSETALGDYLQFTGRKSTLKAKEIEVVNLITSQINNCNYCLAAHTAIAKMNGFTDSQIVELRNGTAPFDSKIDALVRLVGEAVENRGKISEERLNAFFEAGYTEANLVDVNIAIGQKTISNFIHNMTGFAIDFPLAPELQLETI
ncbi:MAG: carboxymuconolactone decarboxylase family protein [Bacteroidota bacterium]